MKLEKNAHAPTHTHTYIQTRNSSLKGQVNVRRIIHIQQRF